MYSKTFQMYPNRNFSPINSIRMNIHIKSVLGALAFSLLFYSKTFGLNIVLISVIVLVLLTSLRKERPIPWGYALTYFFTAFMVFIDPTGFKIFIHFMAFLVLVGKWISQTSPIYLSWLMGMVNMLIASVARLIQNNPSQEKQKKISSKTILYSKGALVAGALLIFFAVLYRKANPIFDELITQIDLSFISIPWVFFTLLGYVLFLNLLRPYHPTDLIALDEQQPDALQPPTIPFTIPQMEKLRNQQTMGTIVLSALALLLIFFLVTDSIYLFQGEQISNAEYSQSVHQGVYALMLSIVCAIAIILYFFRGDLNFYKGNKRIKQLTYLWIGLNLVLVLFTGYKNYEYIEALGLTYKRIGVFVYLSLTLTGLITAYLKVVRIHSFMYLVRTNTAVVFAFLFLSAAIPWDRAITYYNLKTIEQPDIAYLIAIGNTNSDQLYRYAKRHKNRIPQNLKTGIGEKYSDFLEECDEKTWQEYTLYQLKNHKTR